jgi:hypothetical protein
MNKPNIDQHEARKEFELRLELAGILREARSASKYARNLSSAARAAGITPSYLHRIEGAETLASADCYVSLCRIYEIPPYPVLQKLGKLDDASEQLLLHNISTHWELMMLAVSIPPDKLQAAMHALSEVAAHANGRQTHEELYSH